MEQFKNYRFTAEGYHHHSIVIGKNLRSRMPYHLIIDTSSVYADSEITHEEWFVADLVLKGLAGEKIDELPKVWISRKKDGANILHVNTVELKFNREINKNEHRIARLVWSAFVDVIKTIK